jgi:hypothetical protein
LNLEVGTVFRWDNFPSRRFGGESKARWFVCLGSSGIFAQVAIVYLSTTTTQLQHFGTSGTRKKHSKFIFKTNEFPVFDKECAIDFHEQPYSIELAKISNYQNDIEIRGMIDENTMRMIYKRLSSSGFTSPKILSDLHDSFNRAGITGLKKPKHRKK